MEVPGWIFFVFAGLTVLPVFYIILTRNVIRAAYALVVSFLGLAALYVLLNAEFMAVVQILIYAGGIIVLLVFGIMLTRTISERGVITEHRAPLLGGVILVALVLVFSRFIARSAFPPEEAIPVPADPIREIGMLYLTDYILGFELIAFILLVALVGAAFLAKKSGEK